MNDNVVALPGISVLDNSETPAPVQTCVDMLEKALGEAQSGNLIGLALVKVLREPLQSRSNFYGEQGAAPLLISGATGLIWQMGRTINNEET